MGELTNKTKERTMPLTCANADTLSSSERKKVQGDTTSDLHLSLIRLFRRCGHFIGTENRHCQATEGIRVYLIGVRCKIHTPARLAGQPEPPSAVAIERRRTITRRRTR